MVIVLKMTGFAKQTPPKEIQAFLKESFVLDYQLFVCLDESGKKPNSCDGTAFLLVKNEFDAVSVLRLREQRVAGQYINIYRSTIQELKDKKLFPKPSPSLFKLEEKVKGNKQPEVIKFELPKEQERKRICEYESLTSKIRPKSVKGLENFEPETFSSTIRKPNNPSENDIPYDSYIKLFYIPQDCSKKDVLDFLQNTAFPLDILFSKFDSGPHKEKLRGEAFVLLNSTRDALRCIKLSTEKIGSRRMTVVFPSKEEVDTVLFQNQEELEKESTLILSSNAIIKPKSRTSDPLKQKENLDDPNSEIEKESIKPPPSVQHSYTFVRLRNVPLNTQPQELFDFFSDFPVIKYSLKKILTAKQNEEWEIAFPTPEDASAAKRKLSYQLINHLAIEIRII